MARKHLPLMIGGAEVEITGKGFRVITRDDDEREVWWYAAKRAVKRGYHPKTIRLYGGLDSLSDVQKMFDRCNDLWTEMLDWLAAGQLDNRPVYDGHGRRAGGLLLQGPGIGLSRYPVQHPARVRFLGGRAQAGRRQA